jgi:asparagine N-glycosylation enzyme membrane subunit Stt3
MEAYILPASCVYRSSAGLYRMNAYYFFIFLLYILALSIKTSSAGRFQVLTASNMKTDGLSSEMLHRALC